MCPSVVHHKKEAQKRGYNATKNSKETKEKEQNQANHNTQQEMNIHSWKTSTNNSTTIRDEVTHLNQHSHSKKDRKLKEENSIAEAVRKVFEKDHLSAEAETKYR